MAAGWKGATFCVRMRVVINHGDETGRRDLPFTGIATFGRRPKVGERTAIDAYVATLFYSATPGSMAAQAMPPGRAQTCGSSILATLILPKQIR